MTLSQTKKTQMNNFPPFHRSLNYPSYRNTENTKQNEAILNKTADFSRTTIISRPNKTHLNVKTWASNLGIMSSKDYLGFSTL